MKLYITLLLLPQILIASHRREAKEQAKEKITVISSQERRAPRRFGSRRKSVVRTTPGEALNAGGEEAFYSWQVATLERNTFQGTIRNIPWRLGLAYLFERLEEFEERVPSDAQIECEFENRNGVHMLNITRRPRLRT